MTLAQDTQLDRLESARDELFQLFDGWKDTGEVHAVVSMFCAEISVASGVPKDQWLTALGKTYDIVARRWSK